MTEVTETHLPGVGVRHEFTTAAGERLAVLVHRTGRRELALYDRSDPDAPRARLHLSADDSRLLGDLLGANPVSAAVAAVQQLEGVAIDWLRVGRGAGHDGRTIADVALRSRTGATVVAIVRDDVTVPAPGPEATLRAGDVLVVTGTPEGLRLAHELLDA